MGPLPNLVYYASICSGGGGVTLAEYLDGDADLLAIASKCLQLLPPHHSRLSITANFRMFSCIVDDRFLYSAIADEALGGSQVMSFLEQLQGEFASYLALAGLADNRRWEPHCLDGTFDPIFRRLASPLVGIPQKKSSNVSKELLDKKRYADADADVEAALGRRSEYDGYSQAVPCDASSGSRSPSAPLITKTNSSKYKSKKCNDVARDDCETSINSKGNSFEKGQKSDNSKDASGAKVQVQRLGSTKICRSPQAARRMWCRTVKIVFILDAVVCVVLFCVWLRVCKGFSCTK